MYSKQDFARFLKIAILCWSQSKTQRKARHSGKQGSVILCNVMLSLCSTMLIWPYSVMPHWHYSDLLTLLLSLANAAAQLGLRCSAMLSNAYLQCWAMLTMLSNTQQDKKASLDLSIAKVLLNKWPTSRNAIAKLIAFKKLWKIWTSKKTHQIFVKQTMTKSFFKVHNVTWREKITLSI